MTYSAIEQHNAHHLESWACKLGHSTSAHALCRELRISRYILIPVTVLSMGMPILVYRNKLKVAKRENAVMEDDQLKPVNG